MFTTTLKFQRQLRGSVLRCLPSVFMPRVIISPLKTILVVATLLLATQALSKYTSLGKS